MSNAMHSDQVKIERTHNFAAQEFEKAMPNEVIDTSDGSNSGASSRWSLIVWIAGFGALSLIAIHDLVTAVLFR